MFDVFKLWTLGLLWCNGDDIKKAHDFFHIVQSNSMHDIACNDKDLKFNLFLLFHFATDMVYSNVDEFVLLESDDDEN